MSDGVPAVVSKRNHFSPASEIAEFAFAELPKALQTEEMRKFLLDYTEQVIRRVAHAFSEGASRGAEQSAKLLIDPEYYVTVKQRRRSWKKQLQESQDRQEAERIEREQCPTQEQIIQEAARLEEYIQEETARVAWMQVRLAKLQTMKSKNIRFIQ